MKAGLFVSNIVLLAFLIAFFAFEIFHVPGNPILRMFAVASVAFTLGYLNGMKPQ